ncbi:MAG: radical SAM protein, partial [Clostridia bacterium]|nr:radical SAM protein [Clostridia bacterium]
MAVKIVSVEKGSICEKIGIKSSDILVSINGNEIVDIFDYQFYANESELEIIIERSGEILTFNVKKEPFDDLGLEFSSYLMDEQRRCRNNCIFCFIDQLPKGLRESLYFKDDDSRLSFLFGNYITLTNITEHEIDRIIKMH